MVDHQHRTLEAAVAYREILAVVLLLGLPTAGHDSLHPLDHQGESHLPDH
jgi:hypothetical protein